jgi:phosphomannomutase
MYSTIGGRASIMVTGSHIPYGMNGIKFNRPDGEILKDEETPVLSHVASTRFQTYRTGKRISIFD